MENMFINHLVCKAKYLFGGPSFIWKVITKSVAFLGTLATLFGILNTFYQDTFHFELMVKYLWLFILFFVLLSSILSLNFKFSKTFKIDGSDAKITIKIGNIVKEKKSFVISTNTSFITIRDGGFISEKSVQGQFEDLRYKNNLATLDSLIANSLRNVTSSGTATIKGKKYKKYPPGSIAQIHMGEQSIYFLALNDVNDSGQNSSRTIQDFYEAIGKLWNYVENQGHTDELAIPLIGSGRAGITGLTKENVVFNIVDTFITVCRNKSICPRLIIYIYPTDLATLDIKRVFEYTELKAKFNRDNENYAYAKIAAREVFDEEIEKAYKAMLEEEQNAINRKY